LDKKELVEICELNLDSDLKNPKYKYFYCSDKNKKTILVAVS